MPLQPVQIVFRKYDGALHWHFDAYRLGVDEHGTWLGCPAGIEMRRGSEPPILWEVAQALLIPDNAWWTAVFNDAPFRTEIYCDITTVPRWEGDRLTAVDLDLDVLRRRDGTVLIDDEDEFLEHQVRYSYPAEVIAQARRSCDDLYATVLANEEPFATVYHHWLDKIR